MVVCACNPSYLEGWGMRIAWTQETEVAVSQDGTPAQVTEQDLVPTKSKRKKKILWVMNLIQFYIKQGIFFLVLLISTEFSRRKDRFFFFEILLTALPRIVDNFRKSWYWQQGHVQTESCHSACSLCCGLLWGHSSTSWSPLARTFTYSKQCFIINYFPFFPPS